MNNRKIGGALLFGSERDRWTRNVDYKERGLARDPQWSSSQFHISIKTLDLISAKLKDEGCCCLMKLSFLIVPRLEPYTSYFHILSWKSHHPPPFKSHNPSKCHTTFPNVTQPLLKWWSLSLRHATSLFILYPLLKPSNPSSNHVTSPQIVYPLLKSHNLFSNTETLIMSRNLSKSQATYLFFLQPLL